MNILDQVKARREAKGFKLTWFVPSEERMFTIYAKDEAQKEALILDARQNGWILQK